MGFFYHNNNNNQGRGVDDKEYYSNPSSTLALQEGNTTTKNDDTTTTADDTNDSSISECITTEDEKKTGESDDVMIEDPNDPQSYASSASAIPPPPHHYHNHNHHSLHGLEPPSGWETIWERFTTNNDHHSRHLLRQWVSLPTIAVLGDTSSGKSSLLSQLSGLVELPSSHELTTKCPTELQMRYSKNRQATIDIHWNNNKPASASSSAVAQSSSTQSSTAAWHGSSHPDPLGGPMGKSSHTNSNVRHRGRKLLWDQRVLRTAEEWKEIPNILLQAQQVILKQQEMLHASASSLSPSSDGERRSNNDTSPRSTVASDVISIVLTGPMYPKQQTLTLVDLPGLVQGRHNALTESSTVSHDILRLLQPYLTNPHCLLLTVLPANVDYHNAHALQLAAKHDPECRRTCIVWTKPDLIDPGAESTVAEWLQQAPRMLKCRHVHMVKCRGQKALSLQESLQVTLDEEQQYFATKAPWKDMDPTMFGTFLLRQKLCRLQAQLVQNSLPQLLRDLKAQHAQTLAQLQALGGHKPLETAEERRQFYQTTCQRLVEELQTSLSGKKGGNLHSKQTSSSSSSFALASKNHSHGANKRNPTPPPSLLGNRPAVSGDETAYSTMPDNNHQEASSTNSTTSSTMAANRLHQACSVFTNQINQGTLATMRSIVEGAQVLVTSAQGTVRGEVVHLDEEEGYCCVDTYSRDANSADSTTRRVLFEYTGQPLHRRSPTPTASTVEHGNHRVHHVSADDDEDEDEDDGVPPYMEENDVWSDGARVLIAREGGRTYDALRKIPLDCVWTDPTSWLQSHMEQFRTDDLPCFLNVESFANIVQQFMQQDWTPACQDLLEQCKTILQQAMAHALEQALQVPSFSGSRLSLTTATTTTTTTTTTAWNSADAPPPRYPGLRQLLHRHLRQLADSLLMEASQQVESHLAMEAHPFTQDDALFAKMNRARYSRLKRELEVALLAELEQSASAASNSSPTTSSHLYPSHNSTGKGSAIDSNNTGRVGAGSFSSVDAVASSVDAVPSILDAVFARHEQMSVNEHLAFEMELILESYGTIATRRVLDRTPMICWHVFRSFSSFLSNRLAAVTDSDLTAALVERTELTEQFHALQDKCDKLYESIQLLENF